MPKAPIMKDRFRIFAESDAEHMGPLLAQLTRMGLDNIGYELVTDVRTFGNNRKHGTSSEEFAKEYLRAHPTGKFRASEMMHHFLQHGRTASSCYGVLPKLEQSNVIKRFDGGAGTWYERVEQLAIPHLSKAVTPTKKERRPPGFHARHDTPNREFVWGMVKHRKAFTVKEIEQAFRAKARNSNSVSPVLFGMAKAGQVKSLGNGRYEVVRYADQHKKKTTPAKKAAPKAKPAKTSKATPETTHTNTNDNHHDITAETSNG